MYDLYILLFILIVISIIYFSWTDAKKVILGGMGAILGGVGLMTSDSSGTRSVSSGAWSASRSRSRSDLVSGGAVCSLPKDPLEAGVDLSEHHIICDGSNIMHELARVTGSTIMSNSDKAHFLIMIARVLRKRFPNAPMIHIVTKNPNIVRPYQPPMFETTSFYKKYIDDIPNQQKEADTYTQMIVVPKKYPNNEVGERRYQRDYNECYHKKLAAITEEYRNNQYDKFKKWVETEDYPAWYNDQKNKVSIKTKNHFNEMKNASKVLKGLNVMFHLAYEYDIIQSNLDGHHRDARDDVLSLKILGGKVNQYDKSFLLSMDYFKPIDTADMELVPAFEYITILDGQEKNEMNIDGTEVTTNYVEGLKNKIYGYYITDKDNEEQYVKATPFKQSVISAYAPNYCLYIGLDLGPASKKVKT